MNKEQDQNFIKDKIFSINDKNIHFYANGKLLITTENETTYGEYNFLIKDNRCYLKTNPSLIDNLTEITFDIIINESIILIND